jgi:hypothetical protein
LSKARRTPRLEIAYQLSAHARGGQFWRFRITVRQQAFPGEYGLTDLASWTEVGVVDEQHGSTPANEFGASSRIVMVPR